ncbi:tRNA (adenosine(37)-N6)-threonylcarbamoyltransferase complex ATPase subunit type 1 TsaE [Dongia soli]|uniref:tRNA threonylcarbamoyladenosine biosynthesis protein TsaE n=1 Tax=Dongia soli TaxID=600628 RepID=A0ABU5E7U5_9PROT|nr:tRNA (adenosine(37)-N6)-threonylcarbamoyltransferase complex ATPase subunit type 1 TsaE [Dongia soli]MDY0882361.1 tRNA (adenosine(37)-N6)-threonylcarbamoyltransferase complex ATPase subunit type 1 TsaE [Dongia soli]
MEPAKDISVLFARTLPDEAATAALAQDLASFLRPGDVLALWGDLGAGKTSFARALITRLSAEAEDVPSPTFTLVQTYPGQVGETNEPVELWHFDLYRLTAPEQAYDLAIEEAFQDGISLIEWPVRLGYLLPAKRLDLNLTLTEKAGQRRAEIAGNEVWHRRLAPLMTGEA